MKYLIILTLFIVGAVTKVMAQENKAVSLSQVNSGKIIHSKEFKINTNENLEIDVKITHLNNETLKVFILDRKNKIIAQREIIKEGESSLTFDMERQDEYTVRMVSEKPLGIDLRLVQK